MIIDWEKLMELKDIKDKAVAELDNFLEEIYRDPNTRAQMSDITNRYILIRKKHMDYYPPDTIGHRK